MEYTCRVAITFESNKSKTMYGVVKRTIKTSQGVSVVSIMKFIENNGLVEGKELISDMSDDFADRARVYYKEVKGDEPNTWHYNAEYKEEEGTYSIEAEIVAK